MSIYNETLELEDKLNSLIFDGDILSEQINFFNLYLDNKTDKSYNFNKGLEQLFFGNETKEILATENSILHWMYTSLLLLIRKFIEFIEKVYLILEDWCRRIFNADSIYNVLNNKRIEKLKQQYSKLSKDEQKLFDDLLNDATINRMINKQDFINLIDNLGEATDYTIKVMKTSIQNQMQNMFNKAYQLDVKYPWVTNTYVALLSNLGVTISSSRDIKYNSLFTRKQPDNLIILNYKSLDDIFDVQKKYSNIFDSKYKEIIKIPYILKNMRFELRKYEKEVRKINGVDNKVVLNNINYLKQQIIFAISVIRHIRQSNVTMVYRIHTLFNKASFCMKHVLNRRIKEELK